MSLYQGRLKLVSLVQSGSAVVWAVQLRFATLETLGDLTICLA